MGKHKTADAHTYHANRLLPLVEAKIVSVIVDANDDPYIYCGLIVKMPDGSRKQLVFLCDPEGNGPGHLDITDMP